MIPKTELVELIETAARDYEAAIGCAATRTWQMFERHGHIEALNRLMDNADLQLGFKRFRDSGRLDETFEAIMSRHPEYFAVDAVKVALFRLKNPYDLIS